MSVATALMMQYLMEDVLMKPLSALFLIVAMTTSAGVMATGPTSLSASQVKVLPVLVQVNATGRVTRVSPSTQLEPRYQRMLEKNIQEIITGPAKNRRGGVSSQLLMNVALRTEARPDGAYDAHFDYVSAEPLPYASLHWVKVDGRRLALAGDGFLQRGDRNFYQHYYRFNNSGPTNMPGPSVPPPPSNTAQRASFPVRGR